MKTLTLHEAETTFSTILLEIEHQGEHFVICRDGEAIADLIPHPKRKSRLTPHPVISHIEIRYDPTEPLSAEDWPEEE